MLSVGECVHIIRLSPRRGREVTDAWTEAEVSTPVLDGGDRRGESDCTSTNGTEFGGVQGEDGAGLVGAS